ncbi:BQ5605_C001g00268 [Microbotryum silenes-dioicae]|uniref:Crossover junction endonuclease MUS81 n=1 Tax=Microbotryum silenes-dioicae TaxID=796604 RepID=A0A2X0M6S2_9BASI|nr:BQ5605_C001g00268 [Microbotryum silenes-dioicae]
MAPRVVPGNPQWIEWIRTLELAAEEKGSRAANSWAKVRPASHSTRSCSRLTLVSLRSPSLDAFRPPTQARRSFEKCPIVFNHPDEALQLEGVGRKTVETLLHKITEECSVGMPLPERATVPRRVGAAAKGAVAPPVRDATTGNAVPGPSRKRPNSGSVALQEAAEDQLREARRRRLLGLPPEPSSSPSHHQHHSAVAYALARNENVNAAAGLARSRKAAVPKAYVPRRGSGSYAILLALYKSCSYDEPQVWTTKAKLMEEASEFSETPMDRPMAARNGGTEAGTGFYSAWNGMTTLISKELVSCDNKRPIKYSLTDAGYALADSLAEAAGMAKHVRGPGPAPVLWNAPPPPPPPGVARSFQENFVAGGTAGHRLGCAASAIDLASVGPTGRFPNNAHRTRPRSPPLFADLGRMGHDEARSEDDDDDPEFAEQMRQAKALSRQESQHPSSSSSTVMNRDLMNLRPSPPPLPASRPFFDSSLDGRRAVSGHYAAALPAAPGVPAAGNVDLPFEYYYLDESESCTDSTLPLPWPQDIAEPAFPTTPHHSAADARVTRRDQAEVGQEEGTLAPMYRIEYRTAQALHQMTRSVLRSTTLARGTPLPGGRTITGYLRGRVANSVAPGFPSMSVAAFSTAVAASSTARTQFPEMNLLAGYKECPPPLDKDAMYAPPPSVRWLRGDPPLQPPSVARRPADAASTSRATTLDCDGKQDAGSYGTSSPNLSSSRIAAASLISHTTASLPVPLGDRYGPADTAGLSTRLDRTHQKLPPAVVLSRADAPAGRPLARTSSSQNPLLASFDQFPNPLINRHPLDPVKDHVATVPYVHHPFSAKVLLAGTFRVMLIIDSREVGLPMRGKRTEMIKSLEKENVPCDRRMLPLGDMIWVARPINSFGQPTGEDDVVLDAIVERKRLDDLCHSIIDGRYVSQKIRLKDSAISHRIYLIEKYDDKSQFGKAIWTCKSQLQINDGFYVHESGSFKDTITYLKMQTQIVREQYERANKSTSTHQSQDLLVIPDTSIDRPTYLSMQRHLQATSPAYRYLTTYRAFEELNKADAALTLRAQWARMLSCVSGLSAEKTVQFIGRWSTPMQFFAEGSEWSRIVKEDSFVAVEGKPVPKRARKEEDFVVEHLEDVGARGIKGKLGSKVWKLFQTGTAYAE